MRFDGLACVDVIQRAASFHDGMVVANHVLDWSQFARCLQPGERFGFDARGNDANT